ncbi:unnamed protein product [Closterium sp. Yama58-4]|nr:unnamed protein product [Closterium sp. Yama58-4]
MKALEPLEGGPAQQLFGFKSAVAPIRCAEAMILEWMAEPRVGVLMDLGRIRSRLSAILAATAYRRAVSFAAFLVLVARFPRVVNLKKASMSRETAAYLAIVAELGAGRQIKNDCFASVLVQVLGVKESAELQEGFGFFVQHLLSGGLEEAHAKGRGGAGGKGAENAQGEEKGGTGRKAAEEAQGEEGRADGEVVERGGGMEKEEELLSALAGLDITQGDSELSNPESCAEACMYIFDGNNANKMRVEEAAIEEARRRLRGGVGGKVRVWGSGGTGGEGTASDTSGAGADTSGAGADTSGAGADTSGAGADTSGAGADTSGAGADTSGTSASTSGSGAAANTTGGAADTSRAAKSSAVWDASAASAAALAETRPSSRRADGTCASYSAGLVPVNASSVLAAFTYRVARILHWVRIYGSDVVFVRRCFRSKPQDRILQMPHPFRGLPSLLLRLGAIPKPLDDADFPTEWEEWPQGDEAAAKLPHDREARFFQLGIVEESATGVGSTQGCDRVTEQTSKSGRKHTRGKGRRGKASTQGSGIRGGDTNRGFGEDQRGGFSNPSGTAAVAQLPPGWTLPIVRCVADAEFLVEAVSVIVSPPACAYCIHCYRGYTCTIPTIALIAKYSYRPLHVLFNRFLSVFPPHSAGFDTLVDLIGLSPLPPGPPGLVNLARMRGEVEEQGVAFLLLVALMWPASLLDMEQFDG